jgi:tetratricopeptide (TPR) repeat protein
MKFHIIKSIAALFFLFSGSVASAQSENDWKACIQATQSTADAIYAADWNSVITLSKKKLQVCSWRNDPETISSSISSIGLAYYRLGDFINSKIYYEKCIEIYYSRFSCHYWLAILAKEDSDNQKFIEKVGIAETIASRVISRGIPDYEKDKNMIRKYQQNIEEAKIILELISEL